MPHSSLPPFLSLPSLVSLAPLQMIHEICFSFFQWSTPPVFSRYRMTSSGVMKIGASPRATAYAKLRITERTTLPKAQRRRKTSEGNSVSWERAKRKPEGESRYRTIWRDGEERERGKEGEGGRER
jgi:hypothetical protein